jgi:hypothetical protein
LREAVVAAIGSALILDDDGLFDGGEGEPQRGCLAGALNGDWTEAFSRGLPGKCRIEVLGPRRAIDRRRLLGAARSRS